MLLTNFLLFVELEASECLDKDSVLPRFPIFLLLDYALLFLCDSLDRLLLLFHHFHETVEVALQDFLFLINEFLLGSRLRSLVLLLIII